MFYLPKVQPVMQRVIKYLSRATKYLCYISRPLFAQLMDIDKQGILVVNYSERLVTLLREVRQLSELGHTIPSKISKVACTVERVMEWLSPLAPLVVLVFPC